jgi:hypothetical protein
MTKWIEILEGGITFASNPKLSFTDYSADVQDYLTEYRKGHPSARTSPTLGNPTVAPTTQELILSQVESYEPLLLKGLALGALGAIAYMGYREAIGKPTVLSKFAMSSTGTEVVRGSLDFLSNVAKASVSAPGLRILAAFALVEIMKKLKLTTENAGKWIMVGVTTLEGVEVAGDVIGEFMPTLGAKKSDGPSTLAFTDARTINYAMPSQFGGIPELEQPKQLPMNPLVSKAVLALSKGEKKALMS